MSEDGGYAAVLRRYVNVANISNVESIRKNTRNSAINLAAQRNLDPLENVAIEDAVNSINLFLDSIKLPVNVTGSADLKNDALESIDRMEKALHS